ncbi:MULTISPECIES: hypothetical protein [Escherichia]|uniref:hypothetical protein n=1 Tax=Escherichia TaxID=561 RepID=UPI00057BAE95|nr:MULTISPECIES: hypothetical protein [Escherichia]EFB4097151.1 hypothetical protein [Escherichia coli O101]HDW3849113.1 hypothetical protein [Escherichia coli O100:H12]AMQ54574.1 hypothetical protein AX202_25995 [Escherichia coli JJ1887]AOM73315.1 hypothetical protein MS6198_B073 [Escherichia coli]ATM79535.1 hypothetical protein CRN68_01055 [Escherichia coli]
MFTDQNDKNNCRYQFEKIRNAIAVPSEKNIDAATSCGLEVIAQKYDAFRQELNAAGELGDRAYDLDTYSHCITVLQRYFSGNPSGLTERDARIYCHYLQTEHKRFVRLAEELTADR